jgi:flagellar basal-body rod modification protein FlgD
MSQINAFDPTDAALRPAPTNRFSDLSSEDFIKIIFTELSKQDPFQPNDSSALLEQLNSIRSIESDIKLGDQLKDLVFENQLASASSMIGKFIGGLTAENQRVAGFVVSVIRQGDSVNLELDNGWIVPIDGVETVIDPDQLPEPDAVPTTDSE